MSILRQIYAGEDIPLFTTLTVQLPGQTLRYVQGYVNETLGGNVYVGAPIDIALPDKSKGGAQSLRFAVGLMDDSYLEIIQDAIDSGTPCYASAAVWMDTDRTAPAFSTPAMVVQGGTITDRHELQIDCVYWDILNTAWPRERYTIDKAPGVKYMA